MQFRDLDRRAFPGNNGEALLSGESVLQQDADEGERHEGEGEARRDTHTVSVTESPDVSVDPSCRNDELTRGTQDSGNAVHRDGGYEYDHGGGSDGGQEDGKHDILHDLKPGRSCDPCSLLQVCADPFHAVGDHDERVWVGVDHRNEYYAEDSVYSDRRTGKLKDVLE